MTAQRSEGIGIPASTSASVDALISAARREPSREMMCSEMWMAEEGKREVRRKGVKVEVMVDASSSMRLCKS